MIYNDYGDYFDISIHILYLKASLEHLALYPFVELYLLLFSILFHSFIIYFYSFTSLLAILCLLNTFLATFGFCFHFAFPTFTSYAYSVSHSYPMQNKALWSYSRMDSENMLLILINLNSSNVSLCLTKQCLTKIIIIIIIIKTGKLNLVKKRKFFFIFWNLYTGWKQHKNGHFK